MTTSEPRTVDLVVVVPPRVLLLDIAGPLEVVRKANLEQAAMRFNVAYIGPRTACGSSIGIGLGPIAPLPETLPPGAMLLVPGATDTPLGQDPQDPAADAVAEAEIVTWLAKAVQPGMKLVAICSGALLAGKAGLFDGHDCTTHHATIPELVHAAPRARVLDNRLFVDSGDRLSSAGVTAGIDLMLHVVAQEAGHATALAVARYLVVYLRRSGTDPQLSPWLEGRNHIHRAIHRAQDAVVADPAHDWSVATLADIAAASPRNLSRLFNEQTGMSVTDFVNRMRVALAHELVIASQLSIEHVAERAGFASARQFRRAWNRLHGETPKRLRLSRSAGS